MAGPKPEPPRGGGEEKHAAPAEGAAAAPGAAAPAWQAWLPLIVAVVLMPVLAFALTSFVLVPRLQKALANPAGAAEPVHAAEAKAGGHGAAKAEAKSGGHGGGHGAEKEGAETTAGGKQTATLNKLLVNVAGTMASRYLLTSITMVGEASDLTGKVTQHEAQLKDMANGLLSTKTIADLEKPGARNLLRGELLAGFNAILGNSVVQEVYFTEFAIQ